MRISDPVALPSDHPLLAHRIASGCWRLPFVRVIEDFLIPVECDALRDRIDALSPTEAPVTTKHGPVMRKDIRNNERVIFDDVPLAGSLFERVRPHVPGTLFGSPRSTETAGPSWRAVGLNERFRGYRYRPGQRFAPHFDGCFARDDREQSALTLLLYLDDECEGGHTRLLEYGVSIAPRRGTCFMFDHYLLHEGAEVTSGVKHVLRSDVMYRRIDTA